MSHLLLENFKESQKIIEACLTSKELIQNFDTALLHLVNCLSAGNKIISCGNGGSLCDASHFAEELSGRFRKDRRALAALCINDPAHITCCANDFGYEEIFSKGVEAYGRKNDVLLGISTSGNSKNILKAIDKAKSLGMISIALIGKDGGQCIKQADVSIVVPSKSTERIQEVHIKIIHSFIEGIERNLFPELY